MATTSAAWVVAIMSVITGIMGSLLLTVVDPVMQAFFDSPLFTATTTYGSNWMTWAQDAWALWPSLILFGIMLFVWIETRKPQGA